MFYKISPRMNQTTLFSKSPNFSNRTLYKDNVYGDMELELDNIVLRENGSNRSENVIFKRKLTFNEILERINEENKNLYKKIENFLTKSLEEIDYEKGEIEGDKRIQSNLKNALMNSYREMSSTSFRSGR